MGHRHHAIIGATAATNLSVMTTDSPNLARTLSNNMNPRRELYPGEPEDSRRIELVFAKQPWPGFEWAVQEYRQIEADIVARLHDNQAIALEVRQVIAQWIFYCANRDEVPFDQFQEAWNDLCALGFSHDDIRFLKSWVYADYCLWHEQYDAGLEVIEPVIADYEQWLQNAVLRPKKRKYHEDDLEKYKFLRDGLLALKAGGAEAEAWLKLDEARGPTPEQERKNELDLKLVWAMKAIRDTASELSFTELEQKYRQLETDFLASLLPEDEAMVLETKRRIASDILGEAQKHNQPFEVCRQLWKETRALGFEFPHHEAWTTRPYAEYCLRHGQAEEGLAAVEPMLANWQKQIEEDTAEDMTIDYKQEIERMQKLREELVAIKTTARE